MRGEDALKTAFMGRPELRIDDVYMQIFNQSFKEFFTTRKPLMGSTFYHKLFDMFEITTTGDSIEVHVKLVYLNEPGTHILRERLKLMEFTMNNGLLEYDPIDLIVMICTYHYLQGTSMKIHYFLTTVILPIWRGTSFDNGSGDLVKELSNFTVTKERAQSKDDFHGGVKDIKNLKAEIEIRNI